MRRKRSVTTQMIAEKAGVAQSTVTHILNQTPGLKFAEKTRSHVLGVAESMGYHDSLLARSIKKPLKHIGIIVGKAFNNSEAYNPETAIFDGIRVEALDRGYLPVIEAVPTETPPYDATEAAQRIVQSYRCRLIDGFILDKVSFPTKIVSELSDQGIPVVVVNGSPGARTEAAEPIASSNIDSLLAGRLAGEHLFSLGHRHFTHITRPFSHILEGWRPWHTTNLSRGFTTALAELGVAPEHSGVFETEPSDMLRIVSLVDQILSLSSPPTAIFASDDALAVAVINALHRRGKNVPNDISVVGCGDWSPAVYLSPCPLTTIRCPLKTSGRRAVELLVDFLEGREPKERQILLSPELACRSSTAPFSAE